MKRISILISDKAHERLATLADSSGKTPKEWIADRIVPELELPKGKKSLCQRMDEFVKVRDEKKFQSGRNGRPWRELSHKDHKW